MARRPGAVPGAARHRRSRCPRGHWLLVGLVMLVIAIGLLAEGYTHGVLGESSATIAQASAGGPPAPGTVTGGGPVINATGARPDSSSLPPRTVALTFDDGPDPAWTPQILDVLRRYRVPATFFVVGAHAASYPGLVREELADGDEVGSHTYTHLSLAGAGWREQLELTLTQNALAGAAGVRTSLLRPPYCGGPDAVTAADWRAYQKAARDGYLIVLDSLDTRDWARPGVTRIVAAAMPSGQQGAIIMLHDSGGNRAETVRALPQIITRLRARGYRFVTVTGGLGLPGADVPATPAQRIAGLALVITQQAADHAVAMLAVLLVAASVLIVARVLLLVGSARVHRRRAVTATRRRPVAAHEPGVSVVVPAYNEATGITGTVLSMMASRDLLRAASGPGITRNTAERGGCNAMTAPGVSYVRCQVPIPPADRGRGLRQLPPEMVLTGQSPRIARTRCRQAREGPARLVGRLGRSWPGRLKSGRWSPPPRCHRHLPGRHLARGF